MVDLRRAVDEEGEVLDVLVQSKRNKHAALKLMRKLLKKYGFVPDRMITDDLRSYSAAARDVGIEACHERGRWILSNHAAVYNTFNAQRHLTTRRTYRAFRAAAMSTRREAVGAAYDRAGTMTLRALDLIS